MSQLENLKQCPFCGGNKLKLDSKNSRVFDMELRRKVDKPTYSVRCSKCFARGGTSKDKNQAIVNWNTREELD